MGTLELRAESGDVLFLAVPTGASPAAVKVHQIAVGRGRNCGPLVLARLQPSGVVGVKTGLAVAVRADSGVLLAQGKAGVPDEPPVSALGAVLFGRPSQDILTVEDGCLGRRLAPEYRYLSGHENFRGGRRGCEELNGALERNQTLHLRVHLQSP